MKHTPRWSVKWCPSYNKWGLFKDGELFQLFTLEKSAIANMTAMQAKAEEKEPHP